MKVTTRIIAATMVGAMALLPAAPGVADDAADQIATPQSPAATLPQEDITTEAAEPTESMGPVASDEPSPSPEPVEPSPEPTEPAEPTDPTVPTDPTEPTEPAEPTEPTETAYSAGEKPVGQSTFAWGTVVDGPYATVESQVLVDDAWTTVASATASASGSYVLPLSHDAHVVGTTTWRIEATHEGEDHHSDHFEFDRVPHVQARSAGSKPVSQETFTWGTAVGAPHSRVATQVLVNGEWRTSQVRETSSTGYFAIPLTYGSSTVGRTQWRVVVDHDGDQTESSSFAFTRTPSIQALTAGITHVDATTNVWGTLPGLGNTTVWTEVMTASGWSTSQIRTTSASGFYAIPLTYGLHKQGQTLWRVGSRSQYGVHYSGTFTLTRTGFSSAPCLKPGGEAWGSTEQTKRVLRAICARFSEPTSYGGRRGWGTWNTYHTSGRAIDVMISGPVGWDISHWLRANADALKIDEIIYERRIWTRQRSAEGWRWMSSRGNLTADHYDHVHVSVAS